MSDIQTRIQETASSIVTLATERTLHIGTAESCTGGGIAQAITAIAGSSAIFDCGVVTYSNAAKQQLLQVREDTLLRHGAVSKKTAQEMAMGTLSFGVDIGVSVTGIAGPGGGTDHKPVGTACFGLVDKRKTLIRTYREHFDGDRHDVQAQAILHALLLILHTVKN